jgi:glycosyltransferase involved in cell wall biosynthesis
MDCEPLKMLTASDVLDRALKEPQWMKVLSIAHSAGTNRSGRARYEALARLHPDIDTTVVVPSHWRENGQDTPLDLANGKFNFRVERVRFHCLPCVGWYLHYYPDLHDLLSRLRPDVIHLWEEPWSLVAWHAARLRDRILPHAALIIETEQNILRRLPAPFERIRSGTLKRTDLLIGRQAECLSVARACGFEGPTAVIEFGVDSTIFRPTDRPASRDASRAKRRFVLGYVGRIVREKGLDDVIDAVRASGRDIRLYILGAGADRERLLRRAAELGIAERVRALDPRRPPEVAQFINSLDALVLMSRTTRTWKEQFGRVIMEAHACGVPVIGSNSGAIPGVVAQGGWIIKEGDVDALSRLIRRLDDDRTEVARMGAAGLAQAEGRFAVETIADALADAFVKAWQIRQAPRKEVA